LGVHNITTNKNRAKDSCTKDSRAKDSRASDSRGPERLGRALARPDEPVLVLAGPRTVGRLCVRATGDGRSADGADRERRDRAQRGQDGPGHRDGLAILMQLQVTDRTAAAIKARGGGR
jgi:hypothetical protein